MKKANVKDGILAGVMATFFFLGVVPAAGQVERTVVALRGELHVEAPDGSLLSRPAGLAVNGVTVPEALALLSISANVSVAFSPNYLPGGLRVDCDCREVSIAAALDQILSNTEFGYLELRDQIVIAKRAPRETLESLRRLPMRIAEASLRLPVELNGVPPQNGSWVAGEARLQETGVITGRVTEAGTGRPLSGVQVAVDGIQRGSLSNDDGRYLIAGVPAGARTVRAILMGFREESSTVTVQEGTSVVLDFTLTQTAIGLDEIVVTVTGEHRRREIGNVVGRIAVSDSLIAAAPINTLSDLMTARVPGVQVMGQSGMSGVSPTVRIRGISSIALRNDPIFIVDGVRVNTDQTTSAGYGQFGGRLNDLSPAEIESLEIVKGPAAATLYGTDAANGVVVITTKRGRPGPARWTLFAEVGANRPAVPFLDGYHSWGSDPQGNVRRCFLLDAAAGHCSIDSLTVYNPFDDDEVSPVGTGYRHQVGAQVGGGADRFTYFFAADRERETSWLRLSTGEQERLMAERGTASIPSEQIRPNWSERLSLRSTSSARFENGELTLSGGLVLGDRQLPDPGLIIRAGEWGPGYKDPIGGGWRNQARPGETFSVRNRERFTRFTGSLRGNWRPADWLSTRGVVGLDFTGSGLDALQRFGEGPGGAGRLGRRYNARSTALLYSVDLGASAVLQVRPGLSSRTSVGVQFNQRVDQLTSVTGNTLPPGSESILGAATVVGNERDNQTVVAGFYVEEMVGVRDRLFVSGAIRLDGSSSFGQDFRGAVYPKVSLSWMAVDRGPDAALTSVRLRSAYGASGVQPGATDALTIFQIYTAEVDGVRQPAARASTVGNPNLKPETQAEFEAGIDARLYDGRITVEGSYFNRLSTDALIPRPMPPDVGVTARWENLGSVRNSGFEGLVSVLAISTPRFSWDFSLNGSVIRNKLESINLPTETLGFPSVRHVLGFPLYGRWDRPIRSFDDANGNSIIEPNEIVYGDTLEYAGPSFPPRQLSLTTGVTLFNNLVRISSVFDRRSGQIIQNVQEINRNNTIIGAGRAINDPTTPLWEQARTVGMFRGGTRWGFYEDGSFTRWRELSVSLNIPDRFVRGVGLDGGRAILSLTGRNLAVFTEYTGKDPEVDSDPGLVFQGLRFAEGASDNTTAQQTRQFILRLTIGL
jgi:TonB-dependent SusC/RagA subfamily outer membrane receptor